MNSYSKLENTIYSKISRIFLQAVESGIIADNLHQNRVVHFKNSYIKSKIPLQNPEKF